jgi:murein DD-endopeptidase MepM/ murein hydrolase activator NlpD
MKLFFRKFIICSCIALIAIVITGFLMPQRFKMPVDNATKKDYNENSFWYYPWGRSVTHKGVDIFSPEGTNVFSSTDGIVINTGQIEMGGNIILILGPKWRLHYYAHLKEIKVSKYTFVKSGEIIGTVGTSGNAKGKSPHLHYSIFTLIPYIWKMDHDRQGWKKMFYLNPIDYLEK